MEDRHKHEVQKLTPSCGRAPDLRASGYWPPLPHTSAVAVLLKFVMISALRLVTTAFFQPESTCDRPQNLYRNCRVRMYQHFEDSVLKNALLCF